MTVLAAAFFDAFSFLAHNTSTVAELAGKHLVVSGVAWLISIVIALPLGIWLGHIRKGSFLAINVSNFLRALPTLAILAIGASVLSFGFVNSLIALIILALPLILTNAYVGIVGVDPDAVEAAKGMGMTPLQVALRVEVPLALPLIFAGIRTGAVYIIATAPIVSVAGGSSLGDIIFNPASYRLAGVIGASIVVAALALLAEALLAGVQRLVTPTALRGAGAEPAADLMVGAPTVEAAGTSV